MRLRPTLMILAVLFSSLAVTQSGVTPALAATEVACKYFWGVDTVDKDTYYSTGWKDNRSVNDRDYDLFTGSNYVARIEGEHCLTDGFTEGIVYIQNATNKSQKFYLKKSSSRFYRWRIIADTTSGDYYWKLKTVVDYEIDLQANAVPPGRYDLVAEGFKLDGRYDSGGDCPTKKIPRVHCHGNRSPGNGFIIAKSGPTTTVPPAPTWPMDPFVLSDSLRSLDPASTDSRLSYTAEIGCGLKCKDLPVRFAVRLCKVGTSFTDSSCSASGVLKRANTKAIKTSLGRMNFYQADGIKWGPKSTPGQYMAFVALQSSAKGTKVTEGRTTLTKTASGTDPTTPPTTPPTTNPQRTCSWSFPNGGISVGSLAQVGMKIQARFTATSCYREPLPAKVVLTNITTRKSVTMTPVESATTEFPAPSAGADPLGFQTVYDYEVGLSIKTLPRGKYVMRIDMPATLEDGHLLNMDSEKNRTVTVSYSKSATSAPTPAAKTTVPGSTPVTGTTLPGSTPVTGTTLPGSTPVTGTTMPSSGTTIPGSSGGSGSTAAPTTAPIPDVSSVILTADEFRSGSSSSAMGNVLTTVTGTGTPLVVSYNVTLRCTPSCGALPDRIEAKICPGGPGYGYTNGACSRRQYMNAYTSTDGGYSRKYFHNFFDAGTLTGTWKVYLKVTIGSVVHYPTPIAVLTRTN